MESEWLPWTNVILAAIYMGLALHYIATHRRDPRSAVVLMTLACAVYVGVGYAFVALNLRSYVRVLVVYLAPMFSMLLAALIANLMVKR